MVQIRVSPETKIFLPPILLGMGKNIAGSGGIRTHAPEETGALNQRLRPLGHATFLNSSLLSIHMTHRKQLLLPHSCGAKKYFYISVSFQGTTLEAFVVSCAKFVGKKKRCCQKWDLNPRPHTRTRILYAALYQEGKAFTLSLAP